MAARKPTWRDVKKVIGQWPRDQLVGLVQELYPLDARNANFLHARLLSGSTGDDGLAAYKEAVSPAKQFSMLEHCALRHGNVHSADNLYDVLYPVIARYAGRKLGDRGRRSGRKILAQRARPGDLAIKRQATWGMSAETSELALPNSGPTLQVAEEIMGATWTGTQ